MLSIRRVIRLGSAWALLVTGVGLGAFVASPPAGASGFSWSVVPSPNTSPTQENELNGVSCSGPSACIAVGFYDTPEPYPQIRTAYQTLIESWNGSAWSIVPSPSTSPAQDNLLKGVSCSGPSACTAVGYYSTGSTDQTLIESWNGSAWSIVPSPNVSPTLENLLNGVSCWPVGPPSAIYFTGSTPVTRPGTPIRPRLRCPVVVVLLSGDFSPDRRLRVVLLLWAATLSSIAPVGVQPFG